MNAVITAAFALAAAAQPLPAQTNAPAPAPSLADMSYATPVDGDWSYSSTPEYSQTIFADSSGQPQLSLRCMRATRRLTLAKPANAAAPSLAVWTSSQARAFPATFDAASARLSALIGNWDPLLDAIAFSRGRFAVAVSGQSPLVVPAWPDVARVIEDCRV